MVHLPFTCFLLVLTNQLGLFASSIIRDTINSSFGIGCYVCTNKAGTNEECDTLNNTERNNEFYQQPCWAGRKDWQGISQGFHFKQSLFPASACIKISGHEVNNKSASLTVRSCGLDSGSPTSQTEIIRQNMCGRFNFGEGTETRKFRGCIRVCNDNDGCNRSSQSWRM